jgi:hypothetical protein
MAKPTIVTRATKGSALTWTEGDANFTNLQNATITLAGDSGSTATDLNGTVTISGGTGLTSSVSGSTLTVNLDNTAVTAGTYQGAVTVDAQGRVTAATNTLIGYGEGAIYDLGTTGGTIAPNVANGNVQKITLNSALTLNAFTSPVAGQSLTLIIYGGTAYTSITSTMKFAGGVKTLTGTAGCIDIVSIYYDGTNYFASLGKGFA